jgi:hypothetical protein
MFIHIQIISSTCTFVDPKKSYSFVSRNNSPSIAVGLITTQHNNSLGFFNLAFMHFWDTWMTVQTRRQVGVRGGRGRGNLWLYSWAKVCTARLLGFFVFPHPSTRRSEAGGSLLQFYRTNHCRRPVISTAIWPYALSIFCLPFSACRLFRNVWLIDSTISQTFLTWVRTLSLQS